MVQYYKDVLEFHRRFNLPHGLPPQLLPPDLAHFREKFLNEEVTEYAIAGRIGRGCVEPENARAELIQQFDALIDLMYVLLGTAIMHGFSEEMFNEGWRRVHEANMKKVRADPSGVDSKRNSSFDVVKPAGWSPPNHEDLFHTRSPVV